MAEDLGWSCRYFNGDVRFLLIQGRPSFMTDIVQTPDADALRFFASKGLTGGRGVPAWAGEANGARVRRILQITADITRVPLSEITILDLGCGEGAFAIEVALKGARVLALDARTSRMQEGEQIARRLGLDRLRFEQADIRSISVDAHGRFDVIYVLGILYHLDIDDAFTLLKTVYSMCKLFVVIDTSIIEDDAIQVPYAGGICEGLRVREHEDNDPAAVREGRPLASIDNTFSFLFTKRSLIRALRDVGFTSIFECYAPLEPTRPSRRVTFVAVKGVGAGVSTYPWINDKSEEEISSFLRSQEEKHRRAYFLTSPTQIEDPSDMREVRTWGKALVNGLLRPLNLELRRRS